MRAEDVDRDWPEIPEWVDRRELGPAVLADLRGLSKEGAEFVSGHLVAAGALAEEDPDEAWRHARAARSQGGRIAVVRETVGLVAYRAGRWSEAIAELRAARRMSGGPGQLAVIADAERALGHPEKAIEASRSPEAQQLDAEGAAELRIVVAGARADLGERAAALAALRTAASDTDPQSPFAFRVYYAYAAMLQDAGQADEAMTWFIRAADADTGSDSDVAERIAALADASTPREDTAVAGGVAMGDPAAGDPAVGDVAVGDAAVGDPAAGDAATGDAAAEIPPEARSSEL